MKVDRKKWFVKLMNIKLNKMWITQVSRSKREYEIASIDSNDLNCSRFCIASKVFNLFYDCDDGDLWFFFLMSANLYCIFTLPIYWLYNKTRFKLIESFYLEVKQANISILVAKHLNNKKKWIPLHLHVLVKKEEMKMNKWAKM